MITGKDDIMQALKYSRQRESIKNFLAGRKDHPTADIVYTELRKTYPNISLGTVYRNLALLTDLGDIQKITAGDGVDRYDANTTPHNHFICRRCKAVLDLDMEDISYIKDIASEKFDGVIESYSVNFYGICPSCKRDLTNE